MYTFITLDRCRENNPPSRDPRVGRPPGERTRLDLTDGSDLCVDGRKSEGSGGTLPRGLNEDRRGKNQKRV